MVAAVETFGNLAAFASLRKSAWHGLGTVFDTPVSTAEMLDLSHLSGWNLRLLSSDEFYGVKHAKPSQVVVRDNPFTGEVEVLGNVGGRYNMLTNEDALDFGDKFSANRRWETAGSIEAGTRIFATLAEADDIVLDPNGQGDTIKRYTLITTTHDGSGLVVVKRVHERVVCRNTLTVALGEAGAEVKVRHTKTMKERMEAGAKALGFLAENNVAFEAAAQKMIETSVSDKQFWDIVKDVFPEPKEDKKGSLTKWTNRTDTVVGIWNNSTGSMDNLDKSAWRAWQALTETNQWARGTRLIETAAGQENFFAAGAGFDPVSDTFRQDTFDRVMALVK